MLTFRLRFLSTALVAAGVLAGMGQSAHAQQPLAVGGSVAPNTVASPFGGTLLAQSTNNFSATSFTDPTAVISGTILSAVFQNAPGNTTGLDFYYQVTLNGANTVGVDLFNVAGFTTQTGVIATTLVAQTTGAVTGSAIPAGSVAVVNDERTTAQTIFFNFTSQGAGAQLLAGQTSQAQIVRTNATNFRGVNTTIAGNGVSANSGVLGVANPAATGAPEPGSLALLGTGLVSMGGMVARRRRNAK